MNVACSCIGRIAYQKIHVAHDGRLSRQIADIGREFVSLLIASEAVASEFNEPVRLGCEPCDEAIYFVTWSDLTHCRACVRDFDIVQCVGKKRIRCYGHEEGAVVSDALGAHAVIDQILA